MTTPIRLQFGQRPAATATPRALLPLELPAFDPLATASEPARDRLRDGAPGEAVELAAQAVRADRANFLHWYRYGLALAHVGRLAEAETAFLEANTHARRLAPSLDDSNLAQSLAAGWPPAHYGLAALCAAEGDADRSVAFLLAATQAGATLGLDAPSLAERVARDPAFAPVLTHPAFQAFLEGAAQGSLPPPPDGFDELSARFLAGRDDETDGERSFRVYNDALLAAATEAGIDSAAVRGLIADLTMDVVAPQTSPELLDVLGATLLAQAAAEHVDVERWLGRDNPPQVLVQVTDQLAEVVLLGATTARLVGQLAAAGVDPSPVLELLMGSGLGPAALATETKVALGQLLVSQLAIQAVDVSAVLGPELTQALYGPHQAALLEQWLNDPALLAALTSPPEEAALAGADRG